MKILLKLKNRLFKKSHYLGQSTNETIFLSPTIPADIESLINCIKPNKAIGDNSILANIKRIQNGTLRTIKRYDQCIFQSKNSS